MGPKVALAILSAYSVPDLEAAVLRGDDKRFESIPGIGKNLAQRLAEYFVILRAPQPSGERSPKIRSTKSGLIRWGLRCGRRHRPGVHMVGPHVPGR